MKLLLKVAVVMMFSNGICYAEGDVDAISTKELHGMLSDIESELESRGVSIRDKQGRIEKAESRFKKIVNRGSWKNAVIGSVLTAAVTAHPAGLLVGGIAGSMVGKSQKYDKAEEQFAAIEHEIIVDEDDFLTEGEIRLAHFAGEEVDPSLLSGVESVKELAMAPSGDEPFYGAEDSSVDEEGDINTVDFELPETSPTATKQPQVMPMMNVATSNGGAALNAMTQSVANQQSGGRMELESCYGRGAETAAQKRKRLPHCFYMMY
ncbi:hypothetical protein [Marinagarivorans cellulosilyticus]|uniref:Uncharacterized protein n=1 Tax=Marinagarivorans cellulosilyticus TaxID=2721545 RepID=A0AAN1WFZ1_9GAMM|nr:hypothetical protein [Marinagarivorans cellulosilyticus]BCD96891.1 hypothetical protein MARGE09_P1091 [Marinagarivorans cellulosilyticus]